MHVTVTASLPYTVMLNTCYACFHVTSYFISGYILNIGGNFVHRQLKVVSLGE